MMPHFARILLAGVVVAASQMPMLTAAPAHAQAVSREGIALQNQILELRHELDVMRSGGDGGASGGSMLGGARQVAPAPVSGGGSDVTAGLVDRVAGLEDQVRSLRGQIDTLTNALQQQNADLSKRIDDLNFQLTNGGGAPAVPGPAAVAAPPPVPVAPPVHRTPEMAMQEGNAALARRDYATAEAAAREVIAAKNSPRVTDGQFLLAQSLNGKKDYQGAAVAYDDAYNHAPAGNHAQDSLVGLANSLTALGAKPAACQTLDKLRATFPTPRPDLRESIASIRQRAACH